MSSISYNHLNLPSVITFTSGNTIELLYDAGGNKLRKTVKVSGVVQYVQDYLGGIEYRQTGAGAKRIESVYHAEGRNYNTNVDASNTLAWRKEYNFKDHLGNTRLVFTDRNGNGVVDIPGAASTSDVLQENHYYAFGMAFEGAWLQNDSSIRDNLYQFNGKELNDDFGLNWNDYGARWYDGSIARWNSVDPLADQPEQVDKSPYAAFWNNPIKYDDPDGRCPNCGTAAIGAVVGGLIGGGIEIASQLINNGSVNDWSAVGGSALQGGITGGAAGFTGGASLFVTAGVAGGANAIGGAAVHFP